ncbi:MAG: VWA domain-containing protein, partial [Thermoguttaceae bacterium]|nr:VWA domain-containing protein [Thermoguttaceae bacterium]
MRRLPVYLLLDVSGSMSGEPIEAVKNGIQILHSALRKDPYALESAYISVLTFGSEVQQIVPLTEVAMFQPPQISA